MNSLSKKLILFAVSALAVTASIGFLSVANNYGVLKIDFNNLFAENEKNKSQIAEQALTIQQLGEEIRLKDEHIATLNARIEGLVEETDLLQGKVRSLDQKVQQKMDEVAALTKRIKTLETSANGNVGKIAALENERDALLKQVQEYDLRRTDEKELLQAAHKEIELKNRTIRELEKQVSEQKELLGRINTSPVAPNKTPRIEPAIADPQSSSPSEPIGAEADDTIENQKLEIINARKQARIRQIASATKVEYKSIRLKKDLKSKDLEKKKSEDWRYAILEFDLTHPNKDDIMHEEFIVQVFDTDNGRVVPFNESNPIYQDSQIGATGFKFAYNGEPLKIEYFNTQKKTANNYEIRFYYAGKGFMLPLTSSNAKIVEDGTVAAK